MPLSDNGVLTEEEALAHSKYFRQIDSLDSETDCRVIGRLRKAQPENADRLCMTARKPAAVEICPSSP